MEFNSKRFLAYQLCIASFVFYACKKDTINEYKHKALDDNGLVTVLRAVTPTYQLIWADEFNSSGGFNAEKWKYCPRGTSAWEYYFTSGPNYVSQDGNNLLLRMDNAVVPGDNVPYHSGGVETRTKFDMTYGKIEVRAKFKEGRGSWPAIWALVDANRMHPGYYGEFDIMEHVNTENVVHQTIHNNFATNPTTGSSSATSSTSYTKNDYNIYTLTWTPTSAQFYVNNVLRYTYNKASANTDWNQWPFDTPFYIILNQSGGRGWPGPITDADLPFSMHVDYVRVYKLSTLSNGSFETGDLSSWGVYRNGGNANVVSSNPVAGTKAVQLSGGETSIEQVITGLSPNTKYIFGGVGKVSAAGQTASLGVKGFGGSQLTSNVTGTQYQPVSITFTTGPDNTSATLFYYISNNITAYGDGFYLEKL